MEKKELDGFRQYLLPFSCVLHVLIKLTFFLTFCVGVKFGVICQENNMSYVKRGIESEEL